MSDSAVVIEIKYRGTLKVRQSNGGGEMEYTGERVTSEDVRCVVAPSKMVEYVTQEETAYIESHYGPCEIISVEHKPVSMIYRPPVYWMP